MRSRSTSKTLLSSAPVVLGVALAVAGARGDAQVVQEEISQIYLNQLKQLNQLESGEDSESERTPELYAPPSELLNGRVPGVADSAAIADSTTASSRGEHRAPAANKDRSPFDDLRLFGLEVFGRGAGGFQALDEVPVPVDYRLGPGDMLVVNVWGRVDKTYELIVDREGKIFLPVAGAVVVWGLNLEQASARVRSQLATVYSNFKVNVMMGRVRSIRVYVYGEARRTGGYTVSSLSTLMNVLHQAGGPSERGSLRRMRIIRDGRLHRTLDLYQGLLRGEGFEPDMSLSSNDAIFIPVAGARVWVAGEVNRPAIYELAGGETLADVIALAGGLAPDAYSHRIRVDRIAENGRRVVLDVDLADSTAARPARDGDRVLAFRADEVREDVVVLEGWVKYPGVYGYRPGLRVSDLLRQGEALRPESYLPRAVIRRQLPDGNERIIAVDLSAALGPDLRRGARPSEQGLVAGESTHLGAAANAPAGDDPPAYGAPAIGEPDPQLEPRDVLHIYSAEDIAWRHYVSIDGEVKTPGSFILAKDMRISDLVFEAGGLKPRADLTRAELVRLDEGGRSEVFPVDLGRALVECDPSADLRLQNDDALLVRRIPDRLETEKVTIEGEVRFPGRYSLTRRDEPLSAVLERAGGVTEHAFLAGAVFTRTAIAQDIERQKVVPVFMSFYSDTATGLPLGSLNGQKEQGWPPEPPAPQRMTIDLERVLKADRRQDVPLRDGDRLLVPRAPTGIPVVGNVAAAGSVRYKGGEDVGYYLDRAGGIVPEGDKRGIRIVHANGEVEKTGRGSEIEIGDAIVVPPRPHRPSSWRWLRDAFTVIGGAAATVVVVNLLK